MIERISYIQTQVTEYVANDGKVFKDKEACIRYELDGSDPAPCVRFFAGTRELVPSNSLPLEKVVKCADAYVVVDPARATVFLRAINSKYDREYRDFDLAAGDIFCLRLADGLFYHLEKTINMLQSWRDGIRRVIDGGNSNA